jgi:arylsulfatase A-like enzyme
VARYWGNVERFDRTVGDLLDHLDRERLSANTLVVYVTDNGWIQSLDNPRFAPRSKLSPYDGGLRSPIMLRRPGTIQPRTSDALASAIDIVPTVLAACGVEPPAGLQGVNLLDEKAVAARRQVFGECFTHTLIDLDDPAESLLWRWTVRDRWKLIVPATAGVGSTFPATEGELVDPHSPGRDERGEVELFDVGADPDETRNVAAEHPDVVADLRASLDAWWNPRTSVLGTESGNVGGNAAAPGRGRRPNVVVFLADDLGAHDLGCTGSTFHRSPAIDRLAADGMLFTRGYAAAPVCSPTRAALVTGRHPARVKITNFIDGDRRGSLLPADYLRALPDGEVTVAERLRDAGYATGVFGKWHLGPPADIPTHGFDVTGSTTVGPGSGPADDPLHARAIAAQAAAFIESHRDRPFFCYVPMHSVHVPLITRPELAAEEGRRAVGVGPAFDIPPPMPGDPATRTVQNHPVYAGMVREMDETVATVLAAVAKVGQQENTLVVFTSDNGGLSTAEGAPTSNLPLRAGKGFVYEGGIRVPLIVRWPGVVRPGTTSDLPVTTLDIAATVLDVAGAPGRDDAPLDGTSLEPALSGDGTLGSRDLIWHYPHYSNQGGRPAGALLSGSDKIVEHFEDGTIELFDLASDPGERRNLASEQPARAAELAARLEAWRKQVGAAPSTPNPQPVDPFGPAAVPRRKAG